MKTQKSTLMLKKSIVCLGVLSLLTAGAIEMKGYQTQRESLSFSKHLSRFIVPAKVDGEVMYFKNKEDLSILTTDANELAVIAENNLYVEPLHHQKIHVKPTSLSSLLALQGSDIKNDKSVKDKSVLADVYFALSSASLEPQYKTQLVKVAQEIKKQEADKEWQVVGHTDKSGSATYNLKLAKQRANKVVSFLVEQGVAEKQLKVLTLGEYEAMQLDNSTYNSGLRKVQVIDFKPSLESLARKVQKDNMQIQRRLLAQKQAREAAALVAQQNTIEQDGITALSSLLLMEQNNKSDTVKINTDLQLNELEMVEQEVSLWPTEQHKDSEQSSLSTSHSSKGELDGINHQPTAMLSTTNHLF